jgi:hypothetical protein
MSSAPHTHSSSAGCRGVLRLTVCFWHPNTPDGLAHTPRTHRHAITVAMWALLVPMGAVGGALSWARTRHYTHVVTRKVRAAPPEAKARHICRFEDAREVEIAARCCRVWVDEDTLDEEAVALGERIVMAGLAQLPRDVFMAIWHACYLIDVKGSYQSGYVALQVGCVASSTPSDWGHITFSSPWLLPGTTKASFRRMPMDSPLRVPYTVFHSMEGARRTLRAPRS